MKKEITDLSQEEIKQIFKQRTSIFTEITVEMINQDQRFGYNQEHRFRSDRDRWEEAEAIKQTNEIRLSKGLSDWPLIAYEELLEAVQSDSLLEQRAELVQLAAVVHQWIAAIDNHNNKAKTNG